MLLKLKSKLIEFYSDDKFSDVFSGSVWTIVARVLAILFGIISTVIIARLYSAETLGVVAMVNSFLLLASAVASMGTNTAILRLIPEHITKHSPSSAYGIYKKILVLVVLASILVGVIFYYSSGFIANKILSKPHMVFFVALASVFVVFKALEQVNANTIRGLFLIRTYAIMQLLPQGINLLALVCLTVLLSSPNIPIYTFVGGIGVTAFLGCFIVVRKFNRSTGPKDKTKSLAFSYLLKTSLPMLVSTLMTLIIGQTGILLLGIYKSDADVGYYSVAVKLATLTALVLNSVNSMVGPKFSELFHSGRMDDLFYLAKKSAKLIFWTTSPLLLILLCLGKPILEYGFGSGFGIAYWSLFMLTIAQFVHTCSGATGLFMNMTGHQKQFGLIMIISAIVNLALGFILIPQLGINGAAISGMFSLVGWNIITLIYIKKKYTTTTSYVPFVGLRKNHV